MQLPACMQKPDKNERRCVNIKFSFNICQNENFLTVVMLMQQPKCALTLCFTRFEQQLKMGQKNVPCLFPHIFYLFSFIFSFCLRLPLATALPAHTKQNIAHQKNVYLIVFANQMCDFKMCDVRRCGAHPQTYLTSGAGQKRF